MDEDDAALQLAISLSQSEAEEKERQKKYLTQQYALSNIQFPSTPIGSAPVADQVACHCQSSGVLSKTSADLHLTKVIRDSNLCLCFVRQQDDNEQKTGGGTNELAKYLDRNRWENARENDRTPPTTRQVTKKTNDLFKMFALPSGRSVGSIRSR